MNILKYVIFAFVLVIGISISVNGQEKDGDKKIPKPIAPIVIVNPEKKRDDKPNDKKSDDEKRTKKLRSFVFE